MREKIQNYDDQQNELQKKLQCMEESEKSLNANMEQMKLTNLQNLSRQKSLTNKMEAQKLKFEQDRLSLEQKLREQENANKDVLNKQSLLTAQNQHLLAQNERLKADILAKNEA